MSRARGPFNFEGRSFETHCSNLGCRHLAFSHTPKKGRTGCRVRGCACRRRARFYVVEVQRLGSISARRIAGLPWAGRTT